MLEVIDKGSDSESHPAPLLFVHGTGHGAWSWDDHFLGFFAEKGYRAVALNLRGHGKARLQNRCANVPLATMSTTSSRSRIVCPGDQ